MLRIYVKGLLIVLIILCVAACSGKPQDNDNKNVPVNMPEKELTGVDIYYDCTVGMYNALQHDEKSFCEIVYAAAGTARDTWYEKDCNISLMGSGKDVGFDFFSGEIRKKENYLTYTAEVLKTTIAKLNPEHLNLYITDFTSQLYNYSELANTLIINALEKDLAIGFIGVELKYDENSGNNIFIIAIADNQNLSKYIDNFKTNPTVVAYSGKQSDFQVDTVKKINYQIIANNSGIMGIDYENIQFVENGFYVTPDGNKEAQETEGSFTEIREDYDSKKMKEIIEGTVNFTPNVSRFVNVKNKNSSRNKLKKKNENNSNDKNAKETEEIVQIANSGSPIYLGARSLVYDANKNISGKVKLRVPFKVINGVKLSKIQCNLDFDTYISKSGKFKTADSSNIEVELTRKNNNGLNKPASELDKWQVDDKTNSVILNIFVPNAGKLPINKGAVKLDITFSHNDTIDSVSNWIQNWDQRGCKNLLNFFSSIYTYQKDANIAKNQLTVYLGTGEEKITKRLNRTSEGGNLNE